MDLVSTLLWLDLYGGPNLPKQPINTSPYQQIIIEILLPILIKYMYVYQLVIFGGIQYISSQSEHSPAANLHDFTDFTWK